MSDTVNVSKLNNGLTLVMVPLSGVASVSVIALVGLGSRYESKQTAGMAHFYEHLVHDGTEKYTTSKILSELIEQVGAESNAMTSEDYTGYYVKVESRHIDLALDAISQIVIHPLLLESEVSREKGIIVEEINMREDTPQIKVYDRLMELLFENNGLGLPGAGTKETVQSFERQQFLDLKNNYYVASNMVIVISGDLGDTAKLAGKVEEYFSDLTTGKRQNLEDYQISKPSKIIEVIKRKTDQAHLAIGWRAYSRYEKERYPQALLSIILGGGFSSRLMQKIRQELSLAYSIYTDVDLFNDTGMFTVGAGLDKGRINHAIEVIWQELQNISGKSHPVDQAELRKAKDYLRGKMALQLEDSLRLGMYYGLQQLLEGKIRLVSETMEKLEAVTQEQVENVAKEIFQTDRMTGVVIASGVKENPIQKIFMG